MNRLFRTVPLVAWIVGLAVVFRLAPAFADEVVCPVCGQSFEKTTPKCPNDSTDLKKMGIRLKKPSDDQANGASDPNQIIDTPENTENEGGPRYQRLDSGRGRKRPRQETNHTGYSDRQSRIAGRDRSAGARARRDQRKGETERLDSALRSRYEKIRAHEWRNRQRVLVAEVLAEKNRIRARDLLLSGLGAPLTSLGSRMFWLVQGENPGTVNAVEIDLNLARYRLRMGLSSLIGMRSLPSKNDLIFLESLTFGLQWPNRFSPFFLIRGGIGVLADGHSDADETASFLTSFGAETGVDSWINPWISVTPSVGFMRSKTYETGFNSFTFKISVGF